MRQAVLKDPNWKRRTARFINKVATAAAESPRAMSALCMSPTACLAAKGKLTLASTKLAKANTVLTSMTLGFEAGKQLMAWRNGEISGVEATIETSVAVAAVAGGLGGTSVGAAFGATVSDSLGLGKGPGALVGGFFGAIIGSEAAQKTFRWTIGQVFTLPPSKQIADCYAVLGVDDVASNDNVNSAYRQKARILHPDKVGDDPELREKWYKLESCMTLIKLERDEHARAPEVVEMAGAWFGSEPQADDGHSEL